MREIDLTSDKNPWASVACIGPSRAGKTRFAATFPRPIFLSDASERGWTTIQNMNDEDFYEPGRRPEVIGIENAADMLTALTKVKERVLEDPTSILTVVVDSITFYADQYLTALKTQTAGKDNGWEIYGRLADHLSFLAQDVQKIQRHIVWTMLSKSDEQGRTTGVTIPGQAGTKFLARTDYQLFHRVVRVDPKAPPQWEIRTRTFELGPNAFIFGGRDGGRLPDTLPNLCYRDLEEALGLPNPLELIAPPVSTGNGRTSGKTRRVITAAEARR